MCTQKVPGTTPLFLAQSAVTLHRLGRHKPATVGLDGSISSANNANSASNSSVRARITMAIEERDFILLTGMSLLQHIFP